MKSKRNFLWWYSVIWLIFGASVCFIDWWTIDDSNTGFWFAVMMTPTIVYLFKDIK